jgi:hypothetical protein
MGYSLIPKKRGVETIDVGGFSWPMHLQETGAGFILGYGEGLAPATYVYSQGNNGSPVSNDGYVVTSQESKAMAMCMRGYISVATFVNKQWVEKFPDEKEREKMAEFINPATGTRLYKTFMGEKRLQELEKIADFCERSGGFKIK